MQNIVQFFIILKCCSASESGNEMVRQHVNQSGSMYTVFVDGNTYILRSPSGKEQTLSLDPDHSQPVKRRRRKRPGRYSLSDIVCWLIVH